MKKILVLIPLVILIFGLGWLGRGMISPNQRPTTNQPTTNVYLDFLTEVYDTIQTNYWEKTSDEALNNLFRLGIEKIIGQPLGGTYKTKQDFQKMVIKSLESVPEDKKKEYITQLTDLILSNLKPLGRSRLYTLKQEQSLSNNVKNINPEVNNYDILGVPKEASSSAIAQAYNEKSVQLKKDQRPEAKDELAQVEKAFKTLSDEGAKQTYDQSGVEPTMDYRLIGSDFLYIHQNKFSPTTLEELERITKKFDQVGGPTIFIYDLRDNIGGSVDLLPYFLGPFIGPDQYAYQFFHQGEKTDFKTRIGWMQGLIRYKRMVVLINNQTQSTAELMAAVIKKYNVGIIVGTPSKGWGTIEKVFPITKQIDQSEKYSLFMVHSLTLREDGQPIEGVGVQPTINIKDKDWETQLYNYFHYPELTTVVKQLVK